MLGCSVVGSIYQPVFQAIGTNYGDLLIMQRVRLLHGRVAQSQRWSLQRRRLRLIRGAGGCKGGSYGVLEGPVAAVGSGSHGGCRFACSYAVR